MARDALGRWLPGPDPDRHILSRAERQKGYFYFLHGKMPSRTRAHIRRKIREFYVARNQRRK